MGKNLVKEMNNSYSGRSGITPTYEQLLEATETAIKCGGWRDWVKTHHNVKNIVKELLSD